RGRWRRRSISLPVCLCLGTQQRNEMNREQKAAGIEEVAGQRKEWEAVFAVDYRGISVPQAAELRTRLTEAGARFRVVKNTLTERAGDQAGAAQREEGATSL